MNFSDNNLCHSFVDSDYHKLLSYLQDAVRTFKNNVRFCIPDHSWTDGRDGILIGIPQPHAFSKVIAGRVAYFHKAYSTMSKAMIFDRIKN